MPMSTLKICFKKKKHMNLILFDSDVKVIGKIVVIPSGSLTLGESLVQVTVNGKTHHAFFKNGVRCVVQDNELVFGKRRKARKLQRVS